jgi:hypothetical protein
MKLLKGKSLGLYALAIFLLLYGLQHLIQLHFAGLGTLLALLALAAGILILIGK